MGLYGRNGSIRLVCFSRVLLMSGHKEYSCLHFRPV